MLASNTFSADPSDNVASATQVAQATGITVVKMATTGKALNIGKGFTALSFRDRDVSGAMDPLVMVDHYRMSEPTFGAHPHAGISAVSVLFEDSEGAFHNRDTLGNDFDLMPGDMYWLLAGSGAVHDESPRPGANVHGLQVFVNLPASQRKRAPTSLHVKAGSMPAYQANGSRVRIVLGESNGMTGQQSPALPMTILDGYLDAGSSYVHAVKEQESAWIYAVSGTLVVISGGRQVHLDAGQAITVAETASADGSEIRLVNPDGEATHFALLSAKPFNEPYVQKGPFVMSTDQEIAQVEADFAAGKLGIL